MKEHTRCDMYLACCCVLEVNARPTQFTNGTEEASTLQFGCRPVPSKRSVLQHSVQNIDRKRQHGIATRTKQQHSQVFHRRPSGSPWAGSRGQFHPLRQLATLLARSSLSETIGTIPFYPRIQTAASSSSPSYTYTNELSSSYRQYA